jgi:hypothetical protein
MMPDQNQVLDAIVTRAAGLGLLADGNPVPIVKRKLPKRRQDDPPVMIVVCPSAERRDEIRRYTNRHDRFLYFSTLAVIGRNKDDHLTALPEHTAIRDALKDAFKVKPADLMGLDDLRDVRSAGGRLFDRALSRAGYDFQTVEVTVDIVSDRRPAAAQALGGPHGHIG